MKPKMMGLILQQYKRTIVELRALQVSDDIEDAHSQADKLLIDFLTALGFEEIVNEWEKVPKWYA